MFTSVLRGDCLLLCITSGDVDGGINLSDAELCL